MTLSSGAKRLSKLVQKLPFITATENYQEPPRRRYIIVGGNYQMIEFRRKQLGLSRNEVIPLYNAESTRNLQGLSASAVGGIYYEGVNHMTLRDYDVIADNLYAWIWKTGWHGIEKDAVPYPTSTLINGEK